MQRCGLLELSFENQAGAGEAGLGFLEFGDIEWSDVETGGFDADTRSREGSGKNDCVSESQGVGGVWFGGVDVNPVVGGKGRGVEPGAVGEERIAAEEGDGGLEVQTAGHGDGDDFVSVRREDGGELADAFGVAALREADEEFAANAQNVAALEGAGQRDVLKLAKFGEGLL